MRATAESVQAGTGTGKGILETPEADEIELFGEAQYEADDGFDIAVLVVMDPEGAALGRVLMQEGETGHLRVVGILIRSAQAPE